MIGYTSQYSQLLSQVLANDGLRVADDTEVDLISLPYVLSQE